MRMKVEEDAMYYCMGCKQLRELRTARKVFQSGFITFPTGVRYPLGFCRNDPKIVHAHVTEEDGEPKETERGACQNL